MTNLINIDKLTTISNNFQINDEFKKNTIILTKLNCLTKEYQEDNIIGTFNWSNINRKKEDEFKIVEYVVLNEYDVFDSIYETGKELYKIIKKGKKRESLDTLIRNGFINPDISKSFKNIFNNYVQKYGYPYLIANEIPCPQYEEFIFECIMLYLINEVRKWNFNAKEQSINEYYLEVDKNFIDLYNLIKPELIAIAYEMPEQELIAITSETKKELSIIDSNKMIMIKTLEYGPADHKTNKLVDNYDNIFFLVLQKSLMLYITYHINGKYKEQYALTKQTPIFNEGIEQHRIYQVANSLMGIAYNKLLLSLTATEWNWERIICDIPNCINEFEKEGKYTRCPRHRLNEKNKDKEGKKEAKAFDNWKDYNSKK